MLFTNLNSMRGTGGRLKDEWYDGEKWCEDFFLMIWWMGQWWWNMIDEMNDAWNGDEEW